MACLTSAIEPLRAANEISDTRAFSWELISETGERVRSSAEVGFDADLALNDAEDFDYIFVLSGPRTVFGNHKASNGHLRRLSRHGVNLGGISGGVFPLARAGLLSGHACSVHWCYEAAFSSEFPDHKMTNDVITIDRKRYTVSGAAAAFDLMLHLIDVKLGYATSTEVACWFQHPLVRGQGVRQKIPTYRSQSTSDMLPRIVSEALEVFGRHISEPLPVQEVARMIGVSPRHLERKFKGATGQSPSHYYRSLRMHAARQLVLYSKDTLTQISHAVGYATATPMVRHYRAAFGVSPDADRRKINVFRVENNRALPST